MPNASKNENAFWIATEVDTYRFLMIFASFESGVYVLSDDAKIIKNRSVSTSVAIQKVFSFFGAFGIQYAHQGIDFPMRSRGS